MTDYTAHTCVSIIRMTGGSDEHHGCPYRRSDEASLRASLANLRSEGRQGGREGGGRGEGHSCPFCRWRVCICSAPTCTAQTCTTPCA